MNYKIKIRHLDALARSMSDGHVWYSAHAYLDKRGNVRITLRASREWARSYAIEPREDADPAVTAQADLPIPETELSLEWNARAISGIKACVRMLMEISE